MSSINILHVAIKMYLIFIYLQSVEDKYASFKKSHLALQTEFLNLNHQIGCLKTQLSLRQRAHMPGAHRAPSLDMGGASGGLDVDECEDLRSGEADQQDGIGLQAEGE